MHSDVISVLAAMLREARYKSSLKVSLFDFDKRSCVSLVVKNFEVVKNRAMIRASNSAPSTHRINFETLSTTPLPLPLPSKHATSLLEASCFQFD